MPHRDAALVFFDIDGTLIRTAHAGLRSLNAVFIELQGREPALGDLPIAGRTDLAILRDVFHGVGLPWTDDLVRQVQHAYLARLAVELAAPPPDDGDGFGVLPGVAEMLAALDADEGWLVGLLTGNFEQGARIKLDRFDLWSRFAFGAFGDAHVDRRDLVPVARARAREAGFEPRAVVVIGDTPLDVDCAQAHDAIAVATGTYSINELAETGPDLVAETLSNIDVRELARLVAASPRLPPRGVAQEAPRSFGR